MKSFQEKEKKLYELLNRLNNFDVSKIENKDQIEIENLKVHKNQLEIEKNNLEEKYQSLSQELENAHAKIKMLEINKKKISRNKVNLIKKLTN